jgi:hypothetical protein
MVLLAVLAAQYVLHQDCISLGDGTEMVSHVGSILLDSSEPFTVATSHRILRKPLASSRIKDRVKDQRNQKASAHEKAGAGGGRFDSITIRLSIISQVKRHSHLI